MSRRMWILATCYLGLIVAANWSLQRWGLVDVGLWLVPAGVWAAGLTFSIRDELHERRWLVLALIAIGAVLSWALETSPRIAIASGIAFGLSELADMAVYEPLRRRSHRGAALASNGVGSAIDSFLFLQIAFGGMAGFIGLFITKWIMVLPFLIRGRR